jgi:hypothetical protein
MRRAFVIAALLLGLPACASHAAEGNAWYQMGDANYDAIKSAHDACVTKGGAFQLKQGGDATHLGDFECLAQKGT